MSTRLTETNLCNRRKDQVRSAILLSEPSAALQTGVTIWLPNAAQPSQFASKYSRRHQTPQQQAAAKLAHLRSVVQSFAAAREASVQDATPTAAGGGLPLPLYPPVDDVDAVYESLRLPDIKVGKTRVRQHVNPLSQKLQVLPAKVDWGSVYANPCKPLVLDVGCASGRWLLLLARDSGLDCNYLGLDIRAPLVDRASSWAETLQVSDCVHFRTQNATVGFERLLSTYPGPLELIAIQWHHKRRIVQPGLATAIAQRLSPTGVVYLSSDVHAVAADMRRHFEAHTADILQPSPLHDSLLTFDWGEESTSGPPAAAGGAAPVKQSPASGWADKRWLGVNPTGLHTEREHWVVGLGEPMYRLLLSRKQQTSG